MDHDKIVAKYLRAEVDLLDLAQRDMLPELLNLGAIARLTVSDGKAAQQFKKALQQAIYRGDLKVVKLALVELEAAQPTPDDASDGLPGEIPDWWAKEVAVHRPERPANSIDITRYWISRADYKAFLQANGEWPVPSTDPISHWWPEERRGSNFGGTRKDRLRLVMEEQFSRIRTKTGKPPTARELFDEICRLAEARDGAVSSVVVDWTDDKLVFTDASDKMCDVSFNAFKGRLTNIRKALKVMERPNQS